MSTRVFIDRTGARWTVSEVEAAVAPMENRERRTQPRSGTRSLRNTTRLSTRPHALASLLFERPGERRQLAPAPAAWHSLADDALEDLLHRTTLERSG